MVLVELAAICAVVAFVFFSSDALVYERYRTWGFVAGGAIVALELAQWAGARAALRRAPRLPLREVYASHPLARKERRRIASLFVGSVILAVVFLAIVTTEHQTARAVLLVVALAPGLLALYRVWRYNSWLAISRFPVDPRRLG